MSPQTRIRGSHSLTQPPIRSIKDKETHFKECVFKELCFFLSSPFQKAKTWLCVHSAFESRLVLDSHRNPAPSPFAAPGAPSRPWPPFPARWTPTRVRVILEMRVKSRPGRSGSTLLTSLRGRRLSPRSSARKSPPGVLREGLWGPSPEKAMRTWVSVFF